MQKPILRLICLVFLAFLTLTTCKKELSKKYTISGQLLESSSNPLPVSGYQLTLYQKDLYSLLGSLNGQEINFKTDQNGFFKVTYSTSESKTLFRTTGSNPNMLSITGIDSNKYKDLHPIWYPISANKDTILGRTFLFKKINLFVTKIQLGTPLENNDSLVLTLHTHFSVKYRTIYGPYPVGAVITDTTHDLKISLHDLNSKTYSLTSSIIKNRESVYRLLDFPAMDETYGEQTLVSP